MAETGKREKTMAQVNVTISGKTYRMACEDGQEEHLAGMADQLNESIEQLRQRFGEIGDQRLTVMAAITLADQSAEAKRHLQQLRAEVAGLEEARAAVVERQAGVEAGIAQAINEMASRVEALAARIASGDGGDGPA
jgi:cell division protein ZapA